MNNLTGPWCVSNRKLCEHNLSDAPHVRRDVCSGLGGPCFQGDAYSTELEMPMLEKEEIGGIQFDRMWTEEYQKRKAEIDQLFAKHVADLHKKLNERAFVDGGVLGELPVVTAHLVDGDWTTTGQAKPDDGLTIEKLEDTLKNLGEMFKPVVVAVWFVDCPQYRTRFESVITAALGKSGAFENKEAYSPAMWGVPLFDWDTHVASQDEKEAMMKAGRWFIFLRGVWLEMSDGKHKQVVMNVD